ncbi:single-stranded-DNA-specific exonuclease RecJ [Candidatus Campbellbacteria bacterium CG22_combo_CG10-13_8_21_14_all_36_13]|uniref:Single-stranded-DNA-specific exonuclease RecJ n=1 Tax=Candidatus Campbellbacteria bacterium CG22_combo_CG10-13_8_21_14_all_36_13 TaxID=1974529 RepID=A0A2H0DZJ7_9BACT|nr:MAG: single-stranded-DNA-specific exonuclease RecJ [Candidatus Campbellbacteria bacterium CG22_combo_CG10-13_8_21_14_all_36_13]
MHRYQVLDDLAQEMPDELGHFSSLTKKLLKNRGIHKNEDAQAFLNPSYDDGVHDPFLLKDMDKSVERIIKAVSDNQKVVIFSDYDTDGIPGAVVLHDFFKKIGFENFTNYIPHRNKEGFGLNTDAIQKFVDEGVKLLITIDCGTANNREVEFANEAGIDVIITDHHLPNGDLPDAYAILNPKQPGCEYPFKELCGAGVVFKLVQGLIQHGRREGWPALSSFSEGVEKWLLDMVGIATVSDMVPLVGENRVFARFGLLVLRKSPRPGLQHLLKITGTNQKYLTETDIGFTIGPRINAASRMDKPEDAFELLSTNDLEHAGIHAEHLDGINNERKGVVASMVKEAKKKIEARIAEGRELGPVIVMGNTHWKPSLLGLVCNTLSETYNKPSFLWGRDGSPTIKGSCRSDGVMNLVHLMDKVEDGVLVEFGGHEFSGGFSVTEDGVHHLEEAFTKAYTALGADDVIKSLIEIDTKLSLDDVNWQNYDEIEKLSPFGVGNKQPLFLFEGVIPDSVTTFGKQNNHLKLVFSNSSGQKINAITFFKIPDNFKALDRIGPVNLVAHIEKSTFGYKPELRLRIVDIV